MEQEDVVMCVYIYIHTHKRITHKLPVPLIVEEIS